jgi:ribosomal protein S18 acetylase RimI-like enzyme
MGIRTRWATADDVPFLVDVVLLASRSHVPRGAWDLAFEEHDVRRRFLERLLAGPKLSWCHHRNFLVAEVDGRPAAALAGYVEGAPGMIPDDAAIVGACLEIGLPQEQIDGAFARVTPFVECLPPRIGSPWIIEWVATLPAFRRRGLVHALLVEMLDEGRRRGHAEAQIMILIGNVGAEHAYERVGFQHRDERRSEVFEQLLGTPGIARMWIPEL